MSSDRTLLPHGGRERAALRFAAPLAAACAYGYEVRLAAGDARVDFGIRLGPAPEGRAALAPLVEKLADGDARWERLRRFAAAWRCLGAAVPLVFFEFDEGDGARVPVPSVFAAVRDLGGGAPWRQVLELLAGEPLEREARGRIADCIARLPLHSRLLQVGAMVGRPGSATRLYVSVWKSRVVGYLRAIGYPGDALAVLALHERHASWCESVLLQLDVGAGVGARLGIEFDAQAPGAELRHAEWRELVARLVRAGLCDSDKGDALLRWRRPASASELRRDISHLKIVFDGERAREAKAYLFEERRGLGVRAVSQAGRADRGERGGVGDSGTEGGLAFVAEA